MTRPRHLDLDPPRAGDGPDRWRRRRGYTAAAAVFTAMLVVVIGLGLEIGVAAGKRDADDAATPTPPSRSSAPAPPATTEDPVTTGTETEVISAEMLRLDGRDGDLTVIVTVAVDPNWPGAAAVEVEASDATGQVTSPTQNRGIGAAITVSRPGAARETVWMGDMPSSCEGIDPDQQPTPARLDERRTVTSARGPATLEVTVVSSACTTAENRVRVDTEVVIP